MGRIGQDAINLALFGTICFGAHVYHHLFKKTKLVETASPSIHATRKVCTLSPDAGIEKSSTLIFK